MIPSPLALPAWIYGKAAGLRRAAYAAGWLPTARVPMPVICVGNIASGGTGKTPGVIWLLQYLLSRGKKPAVLTRGYGRENPRDLVVVSDGKNIFADVRKSGDEPLLIARRIPVPVVACADRARGALYVHEHFSANVLVMDDGFQHFGLYRDLDVVLWNAADDAGWLESPGAGVLPAGRLREPLTALSRAGLIFLTKTDGVSARNVASIRDRLAFYSSGKEVVTVRSKFSFVENSGGGAWDIKKFHGLGVLAVSAIARPELFEGALERLGARVERARFRDHHFFMQEETAALSSRAAAEGLLIVTTEKDAIRLPPEFPCVVARFDWEPDGKEGAAWISKIDSVIS